jgi:hypothetical protein
VDPVSTLFDRKLRRELRRKLRRELRPKRQLKLTEDNEENEEQLHQGSFRIAIRLASERPGRLDIPVLSCLRFLL